MKSVRLILASTSPRRRELLASLGLSFEVIPPQFEEHSTDLSPREEALFFAEQKVRSVVSSHALILASDTLIECQGEKIGKPADETQAIDILQKLSGQAHLVHTAVVLLHTETHEMKRHVATASVTFRELSKDEILAYAATGEPLGKAGAYAIQGWGRGFVAKIEGDEDVVIGLPLKPIREWLATFMIGGR